MTHSPDPPEPAGAAEYAGPRTVRRAVAVAASTQMMVVVDGAVLAIALPRMATELDIASGALPWVMNSYALPFAGCLLLGGRIADMIGPTAAVRIGLAVFAVASLGAGAAPSFEALLAFRALQGVGAALLSPASLALLTSVTPPGAERERAVAVWSVTAAVGASASALFGGLLTQTMGWRWVLLINVVIAPVLLLASRSVRPRPLSTDRRPKGLDLPGVLLFLVAFVSLDLAATAGGGGSQLARSVLAGGIAVLALTGLVLVERKVRHPLLPLHLLRQRRVAYTNGAAIALMAGGAATGYYTTLYAQDVTGLSPLVTALCMLPATVAGVLVSRRVAWLIGKLGERNCRTAGPLLAAGAQLGLALCESLRVPFYALIPLLVVLSVGSSVAVITLTSSATRSLPPHQSGLAGGLITASGQSGASIGLAALTGVAAGLTATAAGTSSADRADAVVGQVGIALPLAAALALVAALLARRIPLGSAADGTPEEPPPAASGDQAAHPAPPAAGHPARRPGENDPHP